MDGYIIIPDSKYRQMFKDTMKELFLLYKSKQKETINLFIVKFSRTDRLVDVICSGEINEEEK